MTRRPLERRNHQQSHTLKKFSERALAEKQRNIYSALTIIETSESPFLMTYLKWAQAPALGAALAACFSQTALAHTAVVETVCDNCYITSLSADGTAATGQMMDNFETFVWRQGGKAKRLGRSTFDVLGVMGGQPAISADGRVIASTMLSNDKTLATSGLWRGGEWTQIVPPLPADAGSGDSQDSSVWSLSGDGKTVVGLYWRFGHSGGTAHGSVWKAATGMIGLPTEGGSSRVNGVNRDGTVLTGWEEGSWGNWRAAIWVDGQKTIVGTPEQWSIGQAVNAAGNIVVGQDYDPVSGNVSATRWTWDGATWQAKTLGLLRGTSQGGDSYANGVSDNGKIVVGIARKEWGPGGLGFVWTEKHGRPRAAADFFARFGYTNANYDIINVMAITPNGKSFAVAEQRKSPPWNTRSLILTLSSTAL
jgi:hypothetical protein